MATLIDLDGFSHQKKDVAQSGSGFIGVYSEVVGSAQISFDTANKRTAAHVAALKIIENGSGEYVGRAIAAGIRHVVVSFYIKVDAAPGVLSRIWTISGPTNFPRFYMTTGGNLAMYLGSSTNVTTAGTYDDSAWHLIDLDIDCSGATFTADWSIDGVAQTQVSLGSQTPVDFSNPRIGDGSTGTLTFWMSDYVLSATHADYPIGEHVVLPLYPDGEGTNALGSTNPIVGVGQTSGANFWQNVDDWNGGTPNTTDYVTYTNTATGDAASNYAEFTLQDPDAAYSTIWDVIGYIAGFAAGTSADAATCRVVDSGGTTIDNIGSGIDYSGSTTVLGYYRRLLTRPGAGWDSVISGAKVRWGFATDTNPQPRLSAVMLEFAAPAGPAVVTGAATLTGSGSLSGTGSHTALGASSLSGSGALSASGVRATAGAAALSGTGSLAGSGARVGFGAAALTGVGDLTASGTRLAVGQAALSGSGTLDATGSHTAFAAAALSGTGSLTASGTRTRFGQVDLSGAGDLTASGTRATFGLADLTGTGTLGASGARSTFGAADLTGAGSLSASWSAGGQTGAAALTGTGDLAASGTRTTFAAAALSGTGSLTAIAEHEAFGALALSGTGTLDAEGFAAKLGAAGLSGTGALTASAIVVPPLQPGWPQRSSSGWGIGPSAAWNGDSGTAWDQDSDLEWAPA